MYEVEKTLLKSWGFFSKRQKQQYRFLKIRWRYISRYLCTVWSDILSHTKSLNCTCINGHHVEWVFHVLYDFSIPDQRVDTARCYGWYSVLYQTWFLYTARSWGTSNELILTLLHVFIQECYNAINKFVHIIKIPQNRAQFHNNLIRLNFNP